MKKVLSLVALGVFAMAIATSCCKDEEPKVKNNPTEQPAARDFLDGKTFEYLEDADLPADQRQANDYTFEFSDGKLRLKHIFQDGTEASGEYDRIFTEGLADYTYEKPNIVLSNIEVYETKVTFKDGQKKTEYENRKLDDATLNRKIKVDEEKNLLLIQIDADKEEYAEVPLKK